MKDFFRWREERKRFFKYIYTDCWCRMLSTMCIHICLRFFRLRKSCPKNAHFMDPGSPSGIHSARMIWYNDLKEELTKTNMLQYFQIRRFNFIEENNYFNDGTNKVSFNFFFVQEDSKLKYSF